MLPVNPWHPALYGRLAAERVLDPKTGEVLAEQDEILDHDLARKIADR